MTFILVTGSIMAVSIFLIDHLCRFIGIEMKWISLVLCAIMAFLVNAVAISMSPFLDPSHYMRLGILVIVAAASVTFVNEQLLRRGAKGTDATVECPNAIPEPIKEEPVPVAEVLSTETIAEAEEKAEAAVSAVIATEAAPAGETSEPAKEEPAPEPEGTASAEEDAAVQAAKARAEAKEKALAQAKALQAEKDEARKKAAAELKAKQQAEAKRKVYEQEIAALGTLDSILDYAYDKAKDLPDAAICAYQQAIKSYPEDSYMPFLIIELVNLYKEQANYTEAIKAYKKALSLPIIASNDDMKQEFIKNTRYLTIVQDILSKHHALSTPFPDIPANILQEIEAEFQQPTE